MEKHEICHLGPGHSLNPVWKFCTLCSYRKLFSKCYGLSFYWFKKVLDRFRFFLDWSKFFLTQVKNILNQATVWIRRNTCWKSIFNPSKLLCTNSNSLDWLKIGFQFWKLSKNVCIFTTEFYFLNHVQIENLIGDSFKTIWTYWRTRHFLTFPAFF